MTTHKAFLAAYDAEVQAADRTPAGADHKAICARLAGEYGLDLREAKNVIIDATVGVLGAG